MKKISKLFNQSFIYLFVSSMMFSLLAVAHTVSGLSEAPYSLKMILFFAGTATLIMINISLIVGVIQSKAKKK